MEIKRFLNNKAFSCNVYVCTKENTTFIVDPGFFSNNIKKYLEEKGGLDFILLTHGHFDHIGGVEELLKLYPEAKVYCHFEEEDVIRNSLYNGSKLFLNEKLEPTYKVEYLCDKKNIIDGIEFEVLHTPGHTKGSCCIYLRDEKALFIGDFLFLASIGRTDLPTGSQREIEDSIIKFKHWDIESDTKVYPGHDQPFTIEMLLRLNPYLN